MEATAYQRSDPFLHCVAVAVILAVVGRGNLLQSLDDLHECIAVAGRGVDNKHAVALVGVVGFSQQRRDEALGAIGFNGLLRASAFSGANATASCSAASASAFTEEVGRGEKEQQANGTI